MDHFKMGAVSMSLFYTHRRNRKQDIDSRAVKSNNQFANIAKKTNFKRFD
jgi:hypothetical protein